MHIEEHYKNPATMRQMHVKIRCSRKKKMHAQVFFRIFFKTCTSQLKRFSWFISLIYVVCWRFYFMALQLAGYECALCYDSPTWLTFQMYKTEQNVRVWERCPYYRGNHDEVTFKTPLTVLNVLHVQLPALQTL